MMDWASFTAATTGRQTVEAAKEIIQTLDNVRRPDSLISMAPRQAEELARFLNAYCMELDSSIAELVSTPNALLAQILVERQTALEEALVFVRSAFISPRSNGEDQQAMEAADWMCVEIFGRFVPEQNGPIGPLVAIDAMRSPAIRQAVNPLPLPSLFRVQPLLLERSASPDASESVLAYFPLICMPTSLTRSPEYFPLLSHEVGHAVDHEMGYTGRIMAELKRSRNHEYWAAWIGEIVADFVGLTVSGNAFAVALSGYVGSMGVSEEITTASSYPGLGLRLAFLGDAIDSFGESDERISKLLSPAESLGKLGDSLRAEFRKSVLPALIKITGFQTDQWCQEQRLINKTVANAVKWTKKPSGTLEHSITSFAMLSSVVALSKFRQIKIDSLTLFRKLHEQLSATSKPDWVGSNCKWRFGADILAALRPTYLAGEGQTKVPPDELLRFHHQVVFIAATNGQLEKSLTAAYKRSHRKWQSLEFFFLDDNSLAQVERDPDPKERGRNALRHERDPLILRMRTTQWLIEERDTAIQELTTLLRTGVAEHWALYQFSGPLVFFSGWDMDRPGGRIHVSCQLLGTDLRKCPATDIVWNDVIPSPTYQKYRKHLDQLRLHAKVIAASTGESR